MTLALYLCRRMAFTTALVVLMFTGVALLFEVIEMVRQFGSTNASFGALVFLAALRVPQVVYEILPLMMLLATLALFMAMARSSELVVVRAAGRNALRMLVEPALLALAIGGLGIVLLNPLVATGFRMHEDRIRAMTQGGTQGQLQLSVGSGAIWLRQGDETGQWLVRAEALAPDGETFRRVSFQRLERETSLPLVRIEAETARLVDGEWQLEGVKSWDLLERNPETSARVQDRSILPTDLDTDRIRAIFGNAWGMSVFELPGFIAELDRAGLSSRAHQAQFQSILALPLTVLAMMLIGAVLTLRHARAGNTAVKILVTVMAGFALFFLASFARILGEVGQVPLAFAIWAPPIAAILLSIGALLALEDG